MLLRTDPLPTITAGGIHLPAKIAENFYGELPHVSFNTAIVLAKGTKSTGDFEVGERVGFKRLFFARLEVMKSDGTLLGYIQDEANLLGGIEGEPTYTPVGLNTPPSPKAPPGIRKGYQFGQ